MRIHVYPRAEGFRRAVLVFPVPMAVAPIQLKAASREGLLAGVRDAAEAEALWRKAREDIVRLAQE